MGEGRDRNQPCPCGSGLKYKHCCLNDGPLSRLVFSDYISIRHGELIEGRNRDLERARSLAVADAREIALRPLHTAGIGLALPNHELALDIELGTQAIREYARALEAQMRIHGCRHSRLYWLQLSRRLLPTILDSHNLTTKSLCWTTFQLALRKFADDRVSDVDSAVVEGRRMARPRLVTYEDWESLYILEALSIERQFLATTYRRLHKGCSLRLNEDLQLDTPASPDLEVLMKRYDARSRTGAFDALAVMEGDENANPVNNVLGFMPNWSRDLIFSELLTAIYQVMDVDEVEFEGRTISLSKTLSMMKDEHITNYLPVPIVVSEALRVISDYDDAFLRQLGVSGREVLVFLVAASWATYWELVDLRFAYQTLQRAFVPCTLVWPASTPAFHEMVRDLLGEETDCAEFFVKVSEALEITSERAKQIDLWTRKGWWPVVGTSAGLPFLDLFATVEFLQELSDAAGALDGKHGTRKGSRFPMSVCRFLKEAGAQLLWDGPVEVYENGRLLGDIDLLLAGTAGQAFVVECKAMRDGPGLQKGTESALRRRQKDIEEAWDQAKRMTAALARNEPLRRRISDDIVVLLPVVCTPTPQYIWTLEDEWWYSDVTPVVTTPSELLRLVNQDLTRSGNTVRLDREPEASDFGHDGENAPNSHVDPNQTDRML